MNDSPDEKADAITKRVLWASRLLKAWLPRALGGTASLAFIIWGAMGGGAWTGGVWLLLLGVAVALCSFGAEVAVQKPSYMKLSQMHAEAKKEAEEKSLALERAIRILLIRLGKHCELEGHTDRMSVYYFQAERFFMVSRNSQNPTYEERGRASYSSGEGAIGLAWNADKGQALVKMPSRQDLWRRAAIRQNISPEAIDNISMKSQGLAGYRLEAQGKSIGVLVVESVTPNRVDQSHLDQISQSHIVVAIAELVATFAMMTPAGKSFAEANESKPVKNWKAVEHLMMIGPSPRPPMTGIDADGALRR